MAKKHISPVEQHYSTEEAASLLSVSARTIARYRAAGLLSPWVAIPGRVLFPASTINKFLESRRIGESPKGAK